MEGTLVKVTHQMYCHTKSRHIYSVDTILQKMMLHVMHIEIEEYGMHVDHVALVHVTINKTQDMRHVVLLKCL